MSKMHRKYYILIIIGSIFISLDQITKYYVAYLMDLYQSIEVIKDIFNITYTRNSGAAFGILNGMDSMLITVFFISVSIIAILVICVLFKKTQEHELLMHISLSLIVSGAAGNLIDRIVDHEVIDFLDFHWKQYHWPVFNVADSCITIGMIMLAFNMFRDASIRSS